MGAAALLARTQTESILGFRPRHLRRRSASSRSTPATAAPLRATAAMSRDRRQTSYCRAPAKQQVPVHTWRATQRTAAVPWPPVPRSSIRSFAPVQHATARAPTRRTVRLRRVRRSPVPRRQHAVARLDRHSFPAVPIETVTATWIHKANARFRRHRVPVCANTYAHRRPRSCDAALTRCRHIASGQPRCRHQGPCRPTPRLRRY